jgi:hypothetical protein
MRTSGTTPDDTTREFGERAPSRPQAGKGEAGASFWPPLKNNYAGPEGRTVKIHG